MGSKANLNLAKAWNILRLLGSLSSGRKRICTIMEFGLAVGIVKTLAFAVEFEEFTEDVPLVLFELLARSLEGKYLLLGDNMTLILGKRAGFISKREVGISRVVLRIDIMELVVLTFMLVIPTILTRATIG